MKYIIKLSEEGYFGKKPYSFMDKSEAITFATMKDARKQLNRVRSQHGYPNAEIEKYEKET